MLKLVGLVLSDTHPPVQCSSCENTYGDGASFSRGPKGGMVIVCRRMVYAKMFYGEMVLFSGEDGITPQLE